MNQIQKVKDNIDWSIVVSGLVLTVIVGVSIYGMRAAGLNKAATIVKGGV